MGEIEELREALGWALERLQPKHRIKYWETGDDIGLICYSCAATAYGENPHERFTHKPLCQYKRAKDIFEGKITMEK